MITFSNIQIKYDDFIAINNLNLEIKEGEFFTLLGPSGCGKTSTLRTLVGFIKPAGGSIVVDGKDITNVPIEERKIGMVFQSYALFQTMSVYENIAFGLRVQKMKEKVIDERVKELANLVELTDEQLNKNVSALSGGQQQRVAIARALALKPQIVVFDEPLSNLDAKLRKLLRKELKRIQLASGMTCVYVTHDQEEALTLSDRIAVFNNGFVEQVGTPEEIYNQSKTEFVCKFIGDANFLTRAMVDEINRQSHMMLDVNKKSYIRTEKIISGSKMQDKPGGVHLSGKVLSKEFNGTYSLYKYSVLDGVILNFEKEDGKIKYNIGDEITIYINPKDILQYEEEE